MSDLYLGIDTSNYKTSIAVADSFNETVYARSEYLEVPKGKRGLRQSEAFFMHSNRLPDFIEELCSEIDVTRIRAVGVSSRPRRVEGSYMPCFVSGMNTAREVAAVLGIPVLYFSHQEGHAAAIIEDDPSFSAAADSDVILMHLSGGTTEFLRCRMDDEGYDLEIIGGTLDISIGQLIDRAGVAMGMPFPSGQYLDEMACAYKGEPLHVLPCIKIKDGHFNLSGAETKILRYIEKAPEQEYAALAHELFDTIASVLMDSANKASSSCGADIVYMAGGVASSSYIRSMIASRRKSPGNGIIPEIRFGLPSLSGDNAVGIARLARRIHTR